MIAIVDYGLGNLGSISNMLKKLGQSSIITSDPEVIKDAAKLILPGVGSFDYGITNIRKSGLEDILHEKALKERIPVLGICLGLQIFTKKSEEGQLPGLGWFDAEVVKFPFKMGDNQRIPHMGWNSISQAKESRILNGFEEEKRFYFVHSYYVRSFKSDEVLATTSYGLEFVSALERDNIAGVQFHPEKSHKYGKQLLKNFIELF